LHRYGPTSPYEKIEPIRTKIVLSPYCRKLRCKEIMIRGWDLKVYRKES
jgi:hypothetical protein